MDPIDHRDTSGPETHPSEVHSQIHMDPSGADAHGGDLAAPASDVLDRARGGAEELMDRANRKLQQTGLVERIEQNPLAALGVAVGIGFLLAGSGRRRRHGGTLSRATRQLKGAVVGGLAAALAEEARSLLDHPDGPRAALGQLLNQVFDTTVPEPGERRQEGGAPTGSGGLAH